jgi:hypothetical protein
MIEGVFYCNNCRPDKRLAAQPAGLPGGHHSEHKPYKKVVEEKITIRQIPNLSAHHTKETCTCDTKKKGWFTRFLDWIKKGGAPDKCC